MENIEFIKVKEDYQQGINDLLYQHDDIKEEYIELMILRFLNYSGVNPENVIDCVDVFLGKRQENIDAFKIDLDKGLAYAKENAKTIDDLVYDTLEYVLRDFSDEYEKAITK